MAAGQVSTLDMSQFRRGSESERLDFAQSLVKCLSTQGFVKLINHGVPDVAIDKAFELVGFSKPFLSRLLLITHYLLMRIEWGVLQASEDHQREIQSSSMCQSK
jgi:hypothetical protein